MNTCSINIAKHLKKSFQGFLDHVGMWLLFYVCGGLLSLVVCAMVLVLLFVPIIGWFAVPFLLAGVVSAFSAAGIEKALLILRKNTADIQPFFVKNVQFWILYVASMFIFFVGYMLFIVPGVYLAVRLCLAPYILLDQQCSAVESMTKSWEMTKHNVGAFFGVWVVDKIMQALGGITMLGILLFGPMRTIFLGSVYLSLCNGGDNKCEDNRSQKKEEDDTKDVSQAESFTHDVQEQTYNSLADEQDSMNTYAPHVSDEEDESFKL